MIATNRQLEAIVLALPTSLEALGQIAGFGKKKVERYGKALTAMVRAFTLEAGGHGA